MSLLEVVFSLLMTSMLMLAFLNLEAKSFYYLSRYAFKFDSSINELSYFPEKSLSKKCIQVFSPLRKIFLECHILNPNSGKDAKDLFLLN